MTWWVGDAIGCMIFAPMTQVLLERRVVARGNNRKLTVALPLFLAFILVLALFNFANLLEQNRRSDEFEAQSLALSHALQIRLAAYLETLESMNRYLSGSESEIWNRRKSGEIFPEWQTITAVRDDSGKISHYVAMFSDITERKENELRI